MHWQQNTLTSAELVDADGIHAHIIYGTQVRGDDQPERWNWQLSTDLKRDWSKKNNPLIVPHFHARGHEQHLWLAIEAADKLITGLGFDKPTDRTAEFELKYGIDAEEKRSHEIRREAQEFANRYPPHEYDDDKGKARIWKQRLDNAEAHSRRVQWNYKDAEACLNLAIQKHKKGQSTSAQIMMHEADRIRATMDDDARACAQHAYIAEQYGDGSQPHKYAETALELLDMFSAQQVAAAKILND